MAKRVIGKIKLQIPAGKANPAPPVGPALGQHGVNIMEFCQAFNSKTQGKNGVITPVVITVYHDRTFSFIIKSPPASALLKQAASIAKASPKPGREKIAQVSKEDVRKIAEIKMTGLNAATIKEAVLVIEGTARSMGIEVVE